MRERPLHGIERAREIVVAHAHEEMHVGVLRRCRFQVGTVLYSPDHGGALPGDVVEVVVLVIQVVADVGFEGGEETVFDIGVAVVEARIVAPASS